MDALIILGCLIGKDGYPGRVARFRVSHALRLAVEHYPQSYLILSGGQQPGTPTSEARALATWGLGWAESEWDASTRQHLAARLLYEEGSLTTAESAKNTVRLLRDKGFTQAGLVTDSLHIYRAAYLFARQVADHQLYLHPLPVPGLYADYWRRRRYGRLSKLVLREGGAWVKLLGQQLLGGGRV
ncbi:MAG: YdcF family protein [Desulfobacca sp.]|nr:YdcF family protein [Desulfobacca sp.]